MIKFLPIGGANEIGASCFYLNICGTGILLDCGINPSKKGVKSLPNFELIKDLAIDFVLISHAHQDHIGALPFLIQQFPHVIIYSTLQTKEIANITLHNASNIISSEFEDEEKLRAYSHSEIELLIRSIRTVNYDQAIELIGLRHNSLSNIKIEFYNAGHILGSSYIKIQIEEHIILYTGDLNLSNQCIMSKANFDDQIKVTTLITETTYGNTFSEKIGTWDGELNRITKSINRIINNGGSVLIPVFALGKTQEILASLYLMMQKRLLTETTIYTGGISKEISRLYDYNRYLVERQNVNLEFKEIPQTDLSKIEDLNYFKRNPGIVLASSGMMLEKTTSYKLLDFWLKQQSFAIFGVGYMAEDSPGYRVMNSERFGKICIKEGDEPKIVNCLVERFYFSSHSKREDLLKMVNLLNPKKVILVHGDEKAKDWVGYNLLKEHKDLSLYSSHEGKEIIVA